MPLVRYELKSEFSIANPELYKSVSKHDAEALFEGITMAALAGIVRQLGDLSEFAAEIFCDLHNEVVALCSRGRKLATRVKQLEEKLPALEESVFSETDQLRFAFTQGLEWHPTICVKQNHISDGDLPSFIRKSYDDNREPPRFYLLDSFDVAGPGASLKRYTDPSFFKTVWANTELLKAERAGRRARKTKKEKKSELFKEAAPPSLSTESMSLLKASKYIHSVHTLTDPYSESGRSKVHPLSSDDLLEKDTLRISAREIEASSLLRKSRFPSASDSDPATFADSLDQFVDALTSMDPEPEPDSEKIKFSVLDESRPTSSGSNHVDSQDEAASNSKSRCLEVTDQKAQDKTGNLYTELSFYSSTSPSEISSPSLSPSELSEASYSQHVFSVLDSPVESAVPEASSRACMLFSPGSPTLDAAVFEEQTPPLPPLPPSKWRTSRKSPAESVAELPTSSPSVEEEEVVVTSQRHESLMDSIVSHDKEKLRKVCGHTQARSLDNSRDVLLEQIRSKSFNLKHAVQERSDAAQEKGDASARPAADVNVAAILEKASAIRQAFEDSDDDDGFG